MVKEFAVRGQVFHTTDNPATSANAWTFFDDGIVVVADGKIKDVVANNSNGNLNQIRDRIPVYEYPDCLICPGFVDAHIHYAQTRIVGCPAPGLLEWLNKYTFPEELRFESSDYAAEVAIDFFDELLSNGTTCASVFPTVHAESVNKFFEEAQCRSVRVVGGKVLMDRNAPLGLRDGIGQGMTETEELIRKWHGNGRLSYSVIVRFAGTSTREQMSATSDLIQRYPELLFHSHLSETQAEIDWTLQLYPECKDYLAVYESYGMVTSMSLFAHCIHLSNSEMTRMADAGVASVLCPTSNLFLGSGFAQERRLSSKNVQTSLGTDVGGGTSFSMLQTMHEMYKVGRAVDEHLSSFDLFYLATLGGAKAIKVEQYIGNLNKGKEADFVILDGGGDKLTENKIKSAKTPEELLFAYVIFGGKQNIRETWSMGQCVYKRAAVQV